MRLTTYQPIVRKAVGDSRVSDLFAEVLGEPPVFCFPADTPEQFLFGDFYVSPACPDRLAAMETDNYKAFDLVKWCHIISDEDITSQDIASLFENVNPKYAEFIVPESELDNAIFDMPVDMLIPQAMDMCNGEYDDMYSLIAQKNEFVEKSMEENDKSNPDWDNSFRVKFKRQLVSNVMGYLLYRMIFNEPIRMPFDFLPIWPGTEQQVPEQELYLKMDRQLAEMYNDESKFTYKNFDSLCKQFGSAVKRHAAMIAKNLNIAQYDKCPCMSGEKLKFCHGGDINVRPDHI